MRTVGLGAGGHAKVVIEILQLIGDYKLEGLLDPKPELWHTRVLGVSVLGDDDLLSELYDRASGTRSLDWGAQGTPAPGDSFLNTPVVWGSRQSGPYTQAPPSRLPRRSEKAQQSWPVRLLTPWLPWAIT